jgi:hypothetical protein
MRVAGSRAPGAERDVSPLELFFDLVYVFAIGQLSHHLLEHVALRTGAETLILALAVFYAWYMTAWGANWLEPDRLPVALRGRAQSGHFVNGRLLVPNGEKTTYGSIRSGRPKRVSDGGSRKTVSAAIRSPESVSTDSSLATNAPASSLQM